MRGGREVLVPLDELSPEELTVIGQTLKGEEKKQ